MCCKEYPEWMGGVKTAYFSFGQSHAHRVNNQTFDCDCIVKITAPDPRAVMVQIFGDKWGFEYAEMADLNMEYYPRGILELTL